MGSSAAWWLARRGRDVLLLDKFAAGHARGGSHGSARIFRLAYPNERYVRMALESIPLWRDLEAESNTSLYRVTGAVDFGEPHEVGASAAAMAACGVKTQT